MAGGVLNKPASPCQLGRAGNSPDLGIVVAMYADQKRKCFEWRGRKTFDMSEVGN
jgi:hypothetical protein